VHSPKSSTQKPAPIFFVFGRRKKNSAIQIITTMEKGEKETEIVYQIGTYAEKKWRSSVQRHLVGAGRMKIWRMALCIFMK
jgi:hypothetical protein